MSDRASTVPSRWSRLVATAGRALRRYVDWLAGISWKRFLLLSVLAIVAVALLSELPPFSLRWTEDRQIVRPPRRPAVVIDGSRPGRPDYEVRIDESGVRIGPRRAASTPAAGASAAEPPAVTVPLPPGADSAEVREAIEEAKVEIRAALDEGRPRVAIVKGFRLGDHLVQLALVLIFISVMAKVMGAGRRRAEAQAVAATEKAEAEALKRQLVEARLAAMQAQVEPHFLFNTLAAIDHLIETDPPRASRMQKHLITYLRAALPKMRESATTLGRELDLVAAYLEILKVRMEERLTVRLAVPAGLRSAAFPPMMLQSLVENAVKHGLEPCCDAATLTVSAEVIDGALRVAVADTGVGFDPERCPTAGTGLGLANIRERLELLWGARARLSLEANQPQGTVAAIVLPYQVASAGQTPATGAATIAG